VDSLRATNTTECLCRIYLSIWLKSCRKQRHAHNTHLIGWSRDNTQQKEWWRWGQQRESVSGEKTSWVFEYTTCSAGTYCVSYSDVPPVSQEIETTACPCHDNTFIHGHAMSGWMDSETSPASTQDMGNKNCTKMGDGLVENLFAMWKDVWIEYKNDAHGHHRQRQ
jgi:hypothetical protein